MKVSNGSPAGSVAVISGLSSNTTYYIKSYATTNWGTSYSSTTKTVKTALNCGQTLTDQNGNTYGTAIIGSQCWMKTNLKVEKYDNVSTFGGSGTPITQKSTGSSNVSTTQCYRYAPSGGYTNYGYLYNWPATTGYGVSNSPSGSNMTTSQGRTQGACPRGWHIPTYDEMNTLNGNLDNVTNKNNFIGNDSYAYKYPGYLGGDDGGYVAVGNIIRFWTTTIRTGSYHHMLYYNVSSSHGFNTTNSAALSDAAGLSVRCVQDISY